MSNMDYGDVTLEAYARPDMHLRDPGYAGFDMHRILKFPNTFFLPVGWYVGY